MSDEKRQYRTGQGVPIKGEYRCQSGEKVHLQPGENFPMCPVSEKETYWTHEGQ
ncbi:D-lyxose ketol-isomerase [Salirhabdus euzebyi]|uniref:D-lyxose ketol-isomerase n=1 Tax=Salirhabdus euzebyi TaxID=394506 RepID=A0A841Q1W2_9BACI|nr:YjzC family protein [Salirhabdus euzebyi]MBB6451955.1 D-lyxose ketol-isomerase [Salirhabdus euzebyi]